MGNKITAERGPSIYSLLSALETCTKDLYSLTKLAVALHYERERLKDDILAVLKYFK